MVQYMEMKTVSISVNSFVVIQRHKHSHKRPNEQKKEDFSTIDFNVE